MFAHKGKLIDDEWLKEGAVILCRGQNQRTDLSFRREGKADKDSSEICSLKKENTAVP